MKELKINEEIVSPKVMLIDENGKSVGTVSIDQAMYLAYEAELDLVQVSSPPPAGGPPVVKIMDYGKYRYSQEKLESKQKAKSHGPEIKEVRISLKINAHDLNFKTKQAQKFLGSGDKVKVSLKLIGREMIFRERVYKVLENFRQGAGAVFESPVEKMGNRFSVILVAAKKKDLPARLDSAKRAEGKEQR